MKVWLTKTSGPACGQLAGLAGYDDLVQLPRYTASVHVGPCNDAYPLQPSELRTRATQVGKHAELSTLQTDGGSVETMKFPRRDASAAAGAGDTALTATPSATAASVIGAWRVLTVFQ